LFLFVGAPLALAQAGSKPYDVIPGCAPAQTRNLDVRRPVNNFEIPGSRPEGLAPE